MHVYVYVSPVAQEIAVVARLEKDRYRCSIYEDQLCMQAVHVNSQTEQGLWLQGDEFAVAAVAAVADWAGLVTSLQWQQ